MSKFRTAAGLNEPAPLNRERVAASLTELEAQFGLDDEGDAIGRWDGHVFRFFCLGETREIFMVRSFWEPEPPMDLWSHVLEEINTWNSERLWPKAYARAFESRTIVTTELTMNYQDGLTDRQLRRHLTTAIGTALEFYEHLQERFPDHESWLPKAPDAD